MSDFDKEAEREKLREQFAEDESSRESTERMSELLLQGATMTNKHCDTCGDPIFRHEDQEFCPSCHGDGGTNGQQTAQQSGAGQGEEPETAPPERGQGAAEPATPEQVTGERPTTAGQPPAGRPAGAEQPAPEEPAEPAANPQQPSPREDQQTATREPSGRHASATGDLTEARGALVRTVTRLSREAERSDDLARTREYLAGAKEAAEALAAVRQAER